MPSRFYLPASGTAAVNPTIGAAWEHQNVVRRPTSTAKSGTASALSSYSPDVGDHLVDNDAHHVQFVSSALPAQTLVAQTVKIQILGQDISSGGGNLFLTWQIYAVSNDGGAVRGTLLAIRRDNTLLNAGAETNRGDSATTTEVILQADDRLVFEIGVGGLPTAAGGDNNHNATLRFGDALGSTDLPEDDIASDPTMAPWIEFANVIVLVAASGVVLRALRRWL